MRHECESKVFDRDKENDWVTVGQRGTRTCSRENISGAHVTIVGPVLSLLDKLKLVSYRQSRVRLKNFVESLTDESEYRSTRYVLITPENLNIVCNVSPPHGLKALSVCTPVDIGDCSCCKPTAPKTTTRTAPPSQ